MLYPIELWVQAKGGKIYKRPRISASDKFGQPNGKPHTATTSESLVRMEPCGDAGSGILTMPPFGFAFKWWARVNAELQAKCLLAGGGSGKTRAAGSVFREKACAPPHFRYNLPAQCSKD